MQAHEAPQADTFHVRATVAYDGSEFVGFQWQARGRTVQGVLEEAIARVTQAETRVIGSGRTDAGVHARGQEVGFRAQWKHDLPSLQHALNAVLPRDVVVVDLAAAPDGWHPRFSAVRREYRYTVLNQALRDPLERRYAHLVKAPLALDALCAAADVIRGDHDFASFGRAMRTGGTTVRHIYDARWQRTGSRITFDIAGNAFLRGMVRSLVGSMLKVGTGAWTVDRFGAVLAGRDRRESAPPAPACGLCLMHVAYA